MAETIRERLAAALEACGCRVVERTKRRWKLTRFDPVTNVMDGFYFIGASGGLRKGRIYTASVSLTDTAFYKKLLERTGA
jgi:hypothetical protein